MKIIAKNRRALFDYEIQKKFEAGLILRGHEVKSIKSGHISLKGSFVNFHKGELFLNNASIPLYKQAGHLSDYDPERPRKLLLSKKEIDFLRGKNQAEGLTIVPLSVYIKKSLIKAEIALAKGKKKVDKRETIKRRESKVEIERTMKQSR